MSGLLHHHARNAHTEEQRRAAAEMLMEKAMDGFEYDDVPMKPRAYRPRGLSVLMLNCPPGKSFVTDAPLGSVAGTGARLKKKHGMRFATQRLPDGRIRVGRVE